ncbi:MAG: VOC family protein [Planctomycetota bacterium]
MPPLKSAGYSTVIPFLAASDVEKALSFYEAVFGLRRTNVNIQDGRIVHSEMESGGDIVLMVAPDAIHSELNRSPASRGAVSPSEIFVFVADADRAHEQALLHGGKSLAAPRDVPWGERHALIQDPDGYRWLVSQNLGA